MECSPANLVGGCELSFFETHLEIIFQCGTCNDIFFNDNSLTLIETYPLRDYSISFLELVLQFRG